MNVLEIAREAGFTVLLEARIGGHEYSSVYGTKEALEHFADTVREKAALAGPNRRRRFRPCVPVNGPMAIRGRAREEQA
ncbi:hypothetical protein [Paraburkholderia hospita]|uniref:hypothetical protein n=1 Tax=Paraburkholderia TaxID=1822464 RepID=UPI000B344FF8|nr:hypothetical protein [Paraburkholderia hospita]OUL86122.1 hypothetical protein CA603_22820 [Paraburkholderia hospita]